MSETHAAASSLVEGVTGLVKAVPVYEDAVQPAAKEVGKGLVTVAKAVNVALAPLGALVWGYEQIAKWLEPRLSDRLRDTVPENIQPPPPETVGPAIEALRFAAHNPVLREMYAKLIASSMDRTQAKTAHPAFVEVIRQLTASEARVLEVMSKAYYQPTVTIEAHEPTTGAKAFLPPWSDVGGAAGLDADDLIPAYLTNLNRLGLIEMVSDGRTLIRDGAYAAVEAHPFILARRSEATSLFPNHVIRVKRGFMRLTPLGENFCAACVTTEVSEPAKRHQTSSPG